MQNKESKFFKSFWNTIIFLAIIFVIILLIALYRNQNLFQEQEKSPVMKELIEKIVTSNIIRQNIEEYGTKIEENLNLVLKKLNKNIDNNINKVFEKVQNENLELFLNFHYSIVGSYTELFSMAFGDYSKLINEKLFDKEFLQRLEEAKESINNFYKIEEDAHLDFLEDIAILGVDEELNKEELSSLKKLFKEEQAKNSLKLATSTIAALLAVKLATSISAKIMAKVSAQTAIKGSSKIVASSVGASSGLSCGIFAPICAPVFAIGAWIATDAAITSTDEYLNKEEFKKELQDIIESEKQSIKSDLENLYKNHLIEASKDKQEKLKNANIRKRVIDNFR